MRIPFPLAWMVALGIGIGIGIGGCGGGAPKRAALKLVVAAKTLQANGTDRTLVTATVPGDPAGLVVSFSSTGGFLSSSSALPDGAGRATVTLLADREDALLGRTEKPVTLRATVTRTKTDVDSATADLVFVTPTTGAPSLSVKATPSAATADGATVVTLAITAKRLAPGTALTLSSTAGTLSTTTALVGDDGSASATLLAPSAPADAVVFVREPGGVTATATVPFVADGAAQFDLTGTFAQFSPARIKMTSATLTPSPQCVVAPAYVKVDVVQTGDHVDAVFTTCFVTLVPVKSIAGTVTDDAPPAFVTAIPQVTASFSLASLALGALFDPPPSVVVSGAALQDPAHEALPTSADDARVVDSDNDGRPGVTVNNSLGGAQNITFRNKGDTRGTVESSNRVVGSTLGDLSALPESSVLGAGNAFLPAMQDVGSTWEMVRVDGQNGAPDMDSNGDGQVSCQEIVDAASFLFTLQPLATPLDCAGVN